MHIVGQHWDGTTPILEAADGDGTLVALRPEGPLHWTVLPGRHCTGSFDGAWRPCPDGAETGGATQCLACFRGRGDPERSRDEPDCVFEPRCAADPTHCACSFGPRPHAVYVAFHGILPKVGMTMERRVATRLTEQGADAWFLVGRRPGRAEARRLERETSYLHRIPEWRSHRETLPQLARPVPWDRIQERAEALRGALGGQPPVHRIHHPLPQPLPSPPRRVAAEGTHAGRFVGAKGNHLVYEEAWRPGRLELGGPGPLAAVKRTDLLGRRIQVHAP